MTTSSMTSQNITHTLVAHGKAIGEFMYGSTQRTWTTLAVTFGMLVLGISMMQSAASGGACAVGM